MKKDIKLRVNECDICQTTKAETVHPIGFLQPLPIPQQPWTDIYMDFIERLPNSGGVDVIFVVVDCLNKYGHFMTLSHHYTSKKVANEFIKGVFKLHRFPNSVVSDRDLVFLSSFWWNLFELWGTTLNYNFPYYPQMEG